MIRPDPLELAAAVAEAAVRRGAEAAEAYVALSRESEARVRAGRVERAARTVSAGCGLRAQRGARLGFASTTDLSPRGLQDLVSTALAVAALAPEDPDAAIPSVPAADPAPLDLVDPVLEELPLETCAELALRAEEAALGTDPRIGPGEGAAFSASWGAVAVASTRGARAVHAGTACALSCRPVAASGEERQRQHWFEGRRFLAELPSPESIGARAASRAARALGARRLTARRAPVVFDPLAAAGFWSGLAPAFLGDAARRGVSFLADELGRQVAAPAVSLREAPRVPRAPGSRPFDGEGIPTSSRAVIDRGVLATFLHDTRSARRAGAVGTGNAVRTYASPPAPGVHALRLDPGRTSPEGLLAAAAHGLYVTHLLGFGVNLASGDFSRGVNGWWFEGGAFDHAVHEATISGNLRDILGRIVLVADDLVLRSATSSPSFLVEEMVISGPGGR